MTDEAIFPIVGWKTRTSPAGYGVLTIKILPVRLGDMTDQSGKTEQVHHFGIHAEQAELIVKDLTEMLATLRAKRKSAN